MKSWTIIALLAVSVALHGMEALSVGDQKKMDSMVKPLSSWSLIRLGINRAEIERRGNATSHIPVTHALAYLFAKDGQRVNTLKIRKKKMVWKRFAGSYAERLEQEHKAGRLLDQIDGLAKFLNMDPGVLYECVKKGDFIAFINAL